MTVRLWGVRPLGVAENCARIFHGRSHHAWAYAASCCLADGMMPVTVRAQEAVRNCCDKASRPDRPMAWRPILARRRITVSEARGVVGPGWSVPPTVGSDTVACETSARPHRAGRHLVSVARGSRPKPQPDNPGQEQNGDDSGEDVGHGSEVAEARSQAIPEIGEQYCPGESAQ